MRHDLNFLAVALLAGFCLGAAAQTPPAATTPAARAEQAYLDARARHDAQPTNHTLAWQFASACFDHCEFMQTNADRARVADEGILACRQALAAEPALAQAHYYLGMDLAQLARTKLIGALGLLEEIEKEWKMVTQLDEHLDFAGADRNLGLLYLQAPGWPLSLGSRTNARVHLLRAVQLHPEYPENHLNLLDALVKWNKEAESAAASNALVQMLPAARARFTGPAWESYWDDWNRRWAALQKQMSQEPVTGAPHNRK